MALGSKLGQMRKIGKIALWVLIKNLSYTLKFETEYFIVIRGCPKHNKISILMKSKIFKILIYVAVAKIFDGLGQIGGWTELHQNWCGNSSYQ